MGTTLHMRMTGDVGWHARKTFIHIKVTCYYEVPKFHHQCSFSILSKSFTRFSRSQCLFKNAGLHSLLSSVIVLRLNYVAQVGI